MPEEKARLLHRRSRLSRGESGAPSPEEPDAVLRFRAWFDTARASSPVHVELCCGRGDFLSALALGTPGALALGVDWSPPVAERAARLLVARGAARAWVVEETNQFFLGTMLPDACCDGIFLNFPDPWPKNRHAERRVLQSGLIAEIDRVLKADGVFRTATDVEFLHAEQTRKIRAWGRWTALHRPADEPPHPAYLVPSVYEVKGRAERRTIYYSAWIKSETGPGPSDERIAGEAPVSGPSSS